MRPFRTGLVASMEDIDNTVAVDETEAAEVAATVADDSSEIQTQSDDIGVTVTEVEDAVQDGETLESVGEVAAEAVESGEGLDEKAAEVASITIESIREKLGFDTSFQVVRSLEAFGNTNTKMSATRLVVEGISETIKQIWASVKAAALRVWDMLKQFFLKLFNSASGLAKHIAGLRERARKLPAGVTPKEKTLKIAGLARAFSVKGQATIKTAEQVIVNTGKMAGIAAELGKLQKNIADTASSLADSKMEASDVSSFCAAASKNADDITESASAIASFQGNLPATKGDKKTGKKVAYSHFGPFIDNTILTVATTESEFMNQKIKRSTVSFNAAKEEAAKEIEALSLPDIQEMLQGANKMVNSLADWKKTQSYYESVTKKAVSLAEEVMKQAGNIMKSTGSDSDQRQALSELKTEVMATIQTMNAFGNRAPALTFRLGSAMADWCSASIRNLQEKA